MAVTYGRVARAAGQVEGGATGAASSLRHRRKFSLNQEPLERRVY